MFPRRDGLPAQNTHNSVKPLRWVRYVVVSICTPNLQGHVASQIRKQVFKYTKEERKKSTQKIVEQMTHSFQVFGQDQPGMGSVSVQRDVHCIEQRFNENELFSICKLFV